MAINEPGPERDSYRLFGNKHRAAVWGAVTRFAIEPPESFTYAELAEITGGIPPTAIHSEVKLLETFGMVEREVKSHGAPIFFNRVASPLWQIAEATAEAFSAIHSADTE